MDPATMAILSAGGASLGGSIWSNITNLGESKRARQFAERMSGSAYQRAVVDMAAAGLNPALAYGQGGASTPGAPTASVDDAVGPAVSSAMHAKRLAEELKVMQSDRQLKDAQAGRTGFENALTEQSTKTQQSLGMMYEAQRVNTEASTAKMMAEMPASERRGMLARIVMPALSAAEGLSRRLFDGQTIGKFGRIAGYEGRRLMSPFYGRR